MVFYYCFKAKTQGGDEVQFLESIDLYWQAPTSRLLNTALRNPILCVCSSLFENLSAVLILKEHDLVHMVGLRLHQ